MTDQDREGFATLMFGLGETYGEPVSDARMEIYFSALADLDLDELRRAATTHVRFSKFFPRPSEIREAIDGSQEDRAELAWLTVPALVRRIGWYGVPKDVDWYDAATRRAALELYGGWKALCESLPADGPELLGYRKAFVAAYRAYDNAAEREALPAGRELSQEESRKVLVTVMAHVRKQLDAGKAS